MTPKQAKEAKEALQRAIDKAGSQNKLGHLLGHKFNTSVARWLNESKSGVPPLMAIKIEKVLNGYVTREQLRPDVFRKD